MRLRSDNTLSGMHFKTNTGPRLNPDSGKDILRYFGAWSRRLISWPEYFNRSWKIPAALVPAVVIYLFSWNIVLA